MARRRAPRRADKPSSSVDAYANDDPPTTRRSQPTDLEVVVTLYASEPRRAPTSRALLAPCDATNEGTRRLRELLRRQTFGAISRRLKCNERSVRHWAREEAKPGLLLRARVEEVLGIPAAAWDQPARAA